MVVLNIFEVLDSGHSICNVCVSVFPVVAEAKNSELTLRHKPLILTAHLQDYERVVVLMQVTCCPTL